jgi:hypothetical protein
MKNQKAVLILTSFLAVSAVLGLFVLSKTLDEFNIKIYFIIVVIVILAVISLSLAYKKFSMQKSGLTVEDELSNRIKHEAGYRAYLASMYMWLFLFLFKDKFTDPDLLIPIGIIVSAIIGGVLKLIVKNKLNEE